MEAWKEELYLAHHGIRGQKWGVRRFQNEDGSLTAKGQKRYDIQEAKAKYKQAKKDYRKAVKTGYRKEDLNTRLGIGILAIQNQKKVDRAIESKRMAMIDSKAAVAKAKGGEKAEFRSYRREMQKSGIRGSAADTQSGNKTTKLYDHLMVKKGKAYADKVENRVQNIAVAELAGSVILSAGMIAAQAYLNRD